MSKLPGVRHALPAWGGVEAEHHFVEVTADTVRCQVPWEWLDPDAQSWHMDPGFPDKRDHYREGYFHAPTVHAPPEYDPHGTVVRVRCYWGPEDYWDQEPDPEHDYDPPPHRFDGKRIWSVTPAMDVHAEPWWIICTKADAA